MTPGIIYYVTDVESTGLSSVYQEVTEISIIRASDRHQLTEMVKCDYPERANVDALRITNKTLADLSQGATKEEVIGKVNRFINQDGMTPSDRCFVGHNVAFDRRFIHALYEKVGEVCPVNIWLDTIHLMKEFLKHADHSQLKIVRTPKGKVSTTLQNCCDTIGIKKFAAAHASKVDTRNTYLLWKRLTEEKGIDHLPFHKSFPHYIKSTNDGPLEDIDNLDMSDVE
jgi:DNA polymerase III epsilon subunit-like protein